MKPTLIHENLKVLLVEDDWECRETIAMMLQLYKVEIIQAGHGLEGYKLYLEEKPGLVVTDVEMPVMDGFELVRKIRKSDRCTPIIIISGYRISGEDIYEGLTIGANDYIHQKPFTHLELLARINKCRIAPVTIGNSMYTASACTLVVNGQSYHLTHMQAAVMSLLICRIGEVVSRKELYRGLYEYDPEGSRALDMHIKNLREFLKADPLLKIVTCRDVGYKLSIID